MKITKEILKKYSPEHFYSCDYNSYNFERGFLHFHYYRFLNIIHTHYFGHCDYSKKLTIKQIKKFMSDTKNKSNLLNSIGRL